MATKPTVTLEWKETRTTTPATALATGYIQRVNWNLGRTNVTDSFTGGTCSIMGRDISVITAAGAPQIGYEAKVTISDNSTSPATTASFLGFISDIRRIYGITANYDTWEITVEGTLGRVGRQTGSITNSAGDTTYQMFGKIETASDGLVKTPTPTSFVGQVSAGTISGQVSDMVDLLMSTEQGYLQEAGASGLGPWAPAVQIIGRATTTAIIITANLADDGSTYQSQTAYKYNEIEFLSAAQNYGTKVTVQATGLADQSAGTGTYVQTIQTVNYTTTQAADIAGYLKTILDLSATVPYRVSFNGATNPTASFPLSLADYGSINKWLRIKFRSTEYFVNTIGLDITATPNDYQINLYLVSNRAYAFFVLDSPYLGVLDTNKLGL